MKVIDEDFFEKIQNKISEVRGIPIYGTVTEPGRSQVLNRAGLIFALEILLEKHRKDFGTLWNPLKGRLALEHKLFTKLNWPLNQIRELSLQDALFILQDELKDTKIPEAAMRVLSSYGSSSARAVFPDVLDTEWDPNLYETIPIKRNW
ncbi:hypothetical protein CBX59_001710 [Salmonella enterica]|nr:hypothetical protein [Salmonella enterica]MBA3175151.1 hypothetical protein [Salmonella enterica]